MKQTNKKLFTEFLKNKFAKYKDLNNVSIPFGYTEISNWRLRLKIFWYEQILNYKVLEMNKELLDKVLTYRNRDIIMSLKQKFKDRDFKIIKFHKFKGKDLVKYELYIIGTENEKQWQGIKCNIL